MGIWIETAVRDRNCNECGKVIPKGTKHAKYNSISFYEKNVCKECIKKILGGLK